MTFDASAPVRALVIEAGSTDVVVSQVKANDLDEMKGLVDGWLEALDLGDGVTMWFNEEGKLMQLPPNPAATALAHNARLIAADLIVGTAVITGLVWDGPDGGQVAADVPQAFIDRCRDLGLTVVEG